MSNKPHPCLLANRERESLIPKLITNPSEKMKTWRDNTEVGVRQATDRPEKNLQKFDIHRDCHLNWLCPDRISLITVICLNETLNLYFCSRVQISMCSYTSKRAVIKHWGAVITACKSVVMPCVQHKYMLKYLESLNGISCVCKLLHSSVSGRIRSVLLESASPRSFVLTHLKTLPSTLRRAAATNHQAITGFRGNCLCDSRAN